ncbi:MAG: hypothetical protein IPK69_10235 [Phycisphaerales bacterium]|nr:MAG: hypothetical protein IPK69_10235 [Phycisphaerales bacterium]
MGKHVKWGGAVCLAIAACSGTALAGPDVIVGDLTGPSNYGLDGTVQVYAVGTVSCNKGDANLSWVSSTPAHPVISQNLYKLSNNRFEQLGQSWLKHGFTALTQNACNLGCSGTGGPQLPPGCSDPYGSGLNGTQSGLGPKYQVNATTGVFPYPFAAGSGSGTKFKRLQALDSKLISGDGLYFVASMYVAADDAAAGNKHNNQSYRQVSVNASTKALTMVGTTQREQPAIKAWQDNDPGVVLTNIDDPDTGRFIVGVRVTGSGPYRYEYAVQNLNSDRSSGSFSVAIPTTANITNVGFSDVDYHSGEPYNGTDWTNTVTSTAVTWNCTETFAQNANANALRWDTIYNFWFDCDIPPAAGTATIGLFKPGTLSSIAGATLTPSASGVPGPINDNCSLPTVISAGATAFNTTDATTDGPNECTFSNYSQIGSDIWFLWTNGPCDGNAVINTCGSSFDTKIAVYSGSSCPTVDGTALACNDDEGTTGSCSGTLQSEVTFPVLAGETFLIRVGGYASGANPPATGAGTLTITAPGNCGPQPPANDLCANAIPVADSALSGGTPITGSTSLATNSGGLPGSPTPCGSSSGSPDVWYTYTPANTASVSINTCGSAYDTVLGLYSGACGSFTQVACNDDEGSTGPCTGTLQSAITATLNAGQTYYIRVTGFNGNSGNYNLLVTGGGGTVTNPPANDDCAGRIGLGLGATPFSTQDATTDGPAHAGCGTATNDVWFNHPQVGDGTLRISTCDVSTTFDTIIAVYQGPTCGDFNALFIACNDDFCGLQSEVTIPVVDGAHYLIRIGGFNGAEGHGTLTLDFTPAPTCVADVDDGTGSGTPDGGVTVDDLLYYLTIYGQGALAADVDDGSGTGTTDGGVTVDDLLYYLTRFNAGC